ncbi:MAG: TatD family hydrolase [Planctomycetota bacterium]|nr:TatD family hydrolase [Planctomycetota bacterium]
MRLVDSHCHLQDQRLSREREAVMARAAAAGVRVLVSNTAEAAEWEAAQAQSAPAIVNFLGIHPWYADQQPPDWEERLRALAAVGSIGIGEIGLDHLKAQSSGEAQKEVFVRQWQIAQRYGLPAAVHCVRAWDCLWAIVNRLPPPPAWMIHAFGGSGDWLAKLAQRGAWFSFGGAITYERNQKARRAAATAPLERILLESDAPDFLPQAARAAGKKTNEPACLPEVAEALAALRGMPLAELAEILWENSRRFLGHLWPTAEGRAR